MESNNMQANKIGGSIRITSDEFGLLWGRHDASFCGQTNERDFPVSMPPLLQ
jgi:hypothetical protein